ncbi:M20/M25/M40 family metallo-hydrolase [Mariniblastus fucicola]|uniref:Leupeptin-inactivating enzyme 1 n=1 Tax=Mariniblastus fucicola TaxID=980251 RepID=A0A5B9PDG7_9BACT|nr:M20/M25/M40 family metallo-hydrolase [Mariniblastus fucicola]QEG23509.1 Leupeptin-inactivating enzyme 1 precursor [Mariniblastus fucicola]
MLLTKFCRARVLTLSCALICTVSMLSGVADAQYATTTAPPEELKAGFDSITEQQAEAFLSVLAGPGFEGRGTGQVGYMKAAHWVAGKLAEFGLEPAGNGETYFQTMPMTRRIAVMDKCKILGSDDFEVEGKNNVGFDRLTDAGEVTGEVVFLTLQGDSPTLPEDLNLREKIVIYSADDKAAGRAPFLIARKRPSASMRVIEDTPVSIAQNLFPGRRRRATSVSGTITSDTAAKIAAAADVQDDWSKNSGAYESGKEFTITIPMREETSGAPNVLAWIEGSDPDLKDEYVVIGAHLDHLGIRNGKVYPGADDNGSGSTAVLSIARAMALNPVKPKRSILFMWFTAEEVGLLGSKYYTDNPIHPVDKMTCMLNIDMVGRNEDTGEGDTDADNEGHIHLVGSQRGDNDLHELILAANEHVGFEFELDMESVWNRSDQINFYNQGVPVAFMFGGMHPDYHKPSDQPADINFKKITAAAKLYYLALYSAADHGRFEPNPSRDSR